ncbi:MAG TPA: hypothetical protein VFA47_11205 [Candidatus Manganitrophaceae bacterium]|nr:hypothetical protein [Candidatus Manganitrophaceae bacterium]
MNKKALTLVVLLAVPGLAFGADPSQGPVKKGESTQAQPDTGQMQTDREQGNPVGRVTPLEDAGKLLGDVVEVDQSKGALAVRTTGGKISRIQLDEPARGELKNIKPGDQVLLTLTIEAKSVVPSDQGGAAQTPGGNGGNGNGTGTLNGKVVRFDPSERILEIQTADGGVSQLQLDEEANGRFKNIKPGDRVVATLEIKAKSVEPLG